MKRNFKRYMMIALLLAAGTLVYIYAQKGYFFRKQETKTESSVQKEEQASEQEENIGTLTDDDPWKEIEKLVAAYYNKQGVSYKGSIKLIDDNGENEKIIEQHTFQYSVVGRSMYYQVSNMEFVSKAGLVLVADHNNELISVSEPGDQNQKSAKLFDIDIFKKLMEEAKAEARVTQLGDQKILTIESISDPQIQGYRIYYNAATYQVKKMLIGMVRLSPLDNNDGGIDEQPVAPNDKADENKEVDEETSEDEFETYTYYMEIAYEETKTLNTSEKSFAPENKFIVKAKEKIQLTAPFSKYQLIINGSIQNETKSPGEEER